MVTTFLLIMVLLVTAERAFELWLAARNRSLALKSGALEYGQKDYRLIVLLHSAWFVAWIAESLLRGPRLDPFWPLWLALFVAGEILRYWCVITLGRFWNIRILVIPGAPRIRRGPYRFLNHPNYVGVAIFLLAAPMIFGAWVTAVVASALNAALLLAVRIPEENRALRSLRRPVPEDR